MSSRALMLSGLVLSLTVGLAALPAGAQETRAGSLVVEHAWARATTPAQKNGAAYLTVRNPGAEPDRLVGARSGEAAGASLHGSAVTAEGVMQMRAADAVEVPAGGEARLAPGGVHVMLTGLKGPLREGASFPLTLVFERAGEVGVEVEVMAGGHGGSSGAGAEHGGPAAGGEHGAQHGH